jgi:hypothetical protein
MKRLPIFLTIIFILLISSVSALQFFEDTTFTQGNVKYTFKEGVNVEFRLVAQGIILDETDKMSFTLQGGEIELTFYKFDDIEKIIGLHSNVQQTLEFAISSSGKQQYLFDGDSYYLDTLYVNTAPMNFTYLALEEEKDEDVFEEKREEEKTNLDIVEKDDVVWFKETLFFFEIPEINVSKNINVGNDIIKITNGTILIILFTILAMVILWKTFKK